MDSIDDEARRIAADIAERRPYRPAVLPEGRPLDAAYAVQEALLRLRLAGPEGEGGLAGWKLAFNSPAATAANGHTEPCIAPLFRPAVRSSGAVLPAADVLHLVVEPEFCLELGADLPGDAVLTREAARAALAAVRPAIELMDHRGAFAVGAPAVQAVAQGIWNIGVVLGPAADPAVLDRRAGIETALWVGDARIGAARDAAPQDPLEGLVWAARTLAARGRPLRAGMILMCGTHLPVQAVDWPAAVRVTMGELGDVAFSLV